MHRTLPLAIQRSTTGPATPEAPPALPQIGRQRLAMRGELSWVFDPLCVLAAALLATLLHTGEMLPGLPGLHPGTADDLAAAAWLGALLAPFLLRDAQFGALAGGGRTAAPLLAHALRFGLLALVILGLGWASGTQDRLTRGWVLLWLSGSFAMTLLARLHVALHVRRALQQGQLAEVVAVVGAGALGDRLLNELRRTAPRSVEVLGLFDDRAGRGGAIAPAGTTAELVELGKTRRIDWIVLALPAEAQQRLEETVLRLKALSAAIVLCPPHVGFALPPQVEGWVGETVAVGWLADQPVPAGEAWARRLVPRWIVTLLELSAAGLAAMVRRIAP